MLQGYNSRDDESIGERDYLRGITKKFMQGLKSRRDESRGENKAEGMRPNDFVKAEAGAKLKQMYGMGGTMKYRKGGANLAMTNSEAVRSGRAGRGAGEQEYGMGGKMEYEKGGMLKGSRRRKADFHNEKYAKVNRRLPGRNIQCFNAYPKRYA